MDDLHMRIPKRWVRIATTVAVTALIVAPVTAIASHRFIDVPDSNIFHSDIEWLADTDVTRGCNPPDNTEFCPGDPVTREAMAAFLHRFAKYLGAEDGTPAQADNANTLDGMDSTDFLGQTEKAADADKLDGLEATQLAPRAAFNATENAPDGADFTLSAEITAPARGVLVISGTVEAFNYAEADLYSCNLEVDDADVPGTSMGSLVDGDSGVNQDEDCSTSGALTVDAGTYTVDLEIRDVLATTVLTDASIWVMWVPFDGTGATPD